MVCVGVHLNFSAVALALRFETNNKTKLYVDNCKRRELFDLLWKIHFSNGNCSYRSYCLARDFHTTFLDYSSAGSFQFGGKCFKGADLLPKLLRDFGEFRINVIWQIIHFFKRFNKNYEKLQNITYKFNLHFFRLEKFFYFFFVLKF